MAWIFLPWGILMPAVRPPWSMQPDDPMTMQVRVRDVRHLEPLRAIMGEKLGPTHVTDTFDYEARAYCRPADFAEAMGKVFTEIDYERFKPTTERHPHTARQLHSAYNAVWSTLFRTLSSEKHRGEYSRGATAADILAASGEGITIPPFIPVRREWKKDVTEFYPRSGDLEDLRPDDEYLSPEEIDPDFIDYDDLDRADHEAGYRAPLSDAEITALVEQVGQAIVAIDEELGPDLTEGYESVPEEDRTKIFEAFDAAKGHTEESWAAYLAAQRDRDPGTGFVPPDEVPGEIDPHAWFFKGDEKLPQSDEVERTELIESFKDDAGTPFGHPEWVLPHNPEAEQRVLTAIFEPTKPEDLPGYVTKRQIYRALGIKWPHQRRRFVRFLAQHPEWSTYNDMVDEDLPQLKIEWKNYQKGRRA